MSTGGREASSALDGILPVDKPAGRTSADVVREAKRRLGVRKIGHLGTLDPFATGLLPLCLGEGAKLAAFLGEADKGYAGTIRLGVATDTLDPTGAVVERQAIPALAPETLERAAAAFRGEIEQIPPMYSALKRSGVRLYEIARRGETVERPPRRVIVRRLDVELLSPERIGIALHCTKGTYVRSLAADLARALGTVGHLEQLRRTRVGDLDVATALSLDALDPDPAAAALVDPRRALPGWRELFAPPALEAKLRRGQQWALAELPPPEAPGERAKVVSPSGALVAVVLAHSRGWGLERVFREALQGPSPVVTRRD